MDYVGDLGVWYLELMDSWDHNVFTLSMFILTKFFGLEYPFPVWEMKKETDEEMMFVGVRRGQLGVVVTNSNSNLSLLKIQIF